MVKKTAKKLKITQVRSTIGEKPSHRKTIEALGLHHIGHSNELQDTPQIRGMVDKVKHLVNWEEIK